MSEFVVGCEEIAVFFSGLLKMGLFFRLFFSLLLILLRVAACSHSSTVFYLPVFHISAGLLVEVSFAA